MNAEIIQSTTGDCKTLAEKLLSDCRPYCLICNGKQSGLRAQITGAGDRDCKCEFDREFF
jgi:hypothetical protein